MAFYGPMITSKLDASGRRPAAGRKQKQRPLLPEGAKLTVKLTGEEMTLSRSLSRVVAQPGQTLTVQDVLRIALAQLGLVHRAKLTKGTDLA